MPASSAAPATTAPAAPADVNDDDEPPRQRAKMAQTATTTTTTTTTNASNASNATTASIATTSSSNAGSAATEAAPVMSTKGMRLLKAAGYQGEGGLGREGQGRTQAIEPELRSRRVGLGYTAHQMPGVAAGVEDSPLFEAADAEGSAAAFVYGPRVDKAYAADVAARNAEYERYDGVTPTAGTDRPPISPTELQHWPIVVAPRLREVVSSKFCRQKMIVDLQQQRWARPGVGRFVRTALNARTALACGAIANAAAAAMAERGLYADDPVPALEIGQLWMLLGLGTIADEHGKVCTACEWGGVVWRCLEVECVFCVCCVHAFLHG